MVIKCIGYQTEFIMNTVYQERNSLDFQNRKILKDRIVCGNKEGHARKLLNMLIDNEFRGDDH